MGKKLLPWTFFAAFVLIPSTNDTGVANSPEHATANERPISDLMLAEDRVEIEPDLPPSPGQARRTSHEKDDHAVSVEGERHDQGHFSKKAISSPSGDEELNDHQDRSSNEASPNSVIHSERPEFILTLFHDNQETSAALAAYLIKVDMLDRHLGKVPIRDVIVWWRAPGGDVQSISLKPLDEKSWVSRVRMEPVEGERNLTVVIIFDGDDEAGEVVQQSYTVQLPDLIVTRNDSRLLIDSGVVAAASTPAEPRQAGAAVSAPEKRATSDASPRSWPLVAVFVMILNIAMAFAAGLAFTLYHRLPKSLLDRLSGKTPDAALKEARAMLAQADESPLATSAVAATQTQRELAAMQVAATASLQLPTVAAPPAPALTSRPEISALEATQQLIASEDMPDETTNPQPTESAGGAEPARLTIGGNAAPDASVSSTSRDSDAVAPALPEIKPTGEKSAAPLSDPEMLATEKLLQNLKETLNLAKNTDRENQPLLIRNNSEILPTEAEPDDVVPDGELDQEAQPQPEELLPEPKVALKTAAFADEKIDFEDLRF